MFSLFHKKDKKKALEKGDASVTVAAEDAQSQPKKNAWLRFKKGLQKSAKVWQSHLQGVFKKGQLTPEILEQIEDLLLAQDFGLPTTTDIIATLKKKKGSGETTLAEVTDLLETYIVEKLAPCAYDFWGDLKKNPSQSQVILCIGVNGSGKTTTLGKLAALAQEKGFSCALVAGDTFRAAAVEQLQAWGDRSKTETLVPTRTKDPAGFIFDAVKQGQDEKKDLIFVDTAGRLQNRQDLMDELSKIIRVLRKLGPELPHKVMLILDGTVGQNALSQMALFSKVCPITDVVVTKLDGTTRAGILVPLKSAYDMRIPFVGMGEGIHDLQPFHATHYAKGLMTREEEDQNA